MRFPLFGFSSFESPNRPPPPSLSSTGAPLKLRNYELTKCTVVSTTRSAVLGIRCWKKEAQVRSARTMLTQVLAFLGGRWAWRGFLHPRPT